MMNNVAIKFAASTLALGLTMVACKPAADASRPRSASANNPKADQESARHYTKAQEAVQKGDFAGALGHSEKAVELSPRDSGYRMLLGDLYLKNGRFNSAETAFADVLTLDPGNARAGLSRALALIANSKSGEALTQLDSLSAASPADLGLAYALAGQPQRAVEMLEPAARAADANARVRQNLALAYALAGDWQKAQTTAAQDVSPADLASRMQQWATFARPSAPWDQVASLLGVTAIEDAGQPVRLALAPAKTEAYAYVPPEQPISPDPQPMAEEPVAVAEAMAPQQVEVPQWISAPPVETAAIEEDPAITPERVAPQPQPSYVRAVQTLVTPQPAVIRTASIAKTTPPTFKPASRPSLRPARAASSGNGRFVVQLGAYSSAASVERAWAGTYRRYGLGDHQPRSTTFSVPGRGTLHRLSVAGFDTRIDAARTCNSIRAKGGSCFVRATAGDAPVRWASRYTSRRPA